MLRRTLLGVIHCVGAEPTIVQQCSYTAPGKLRRQGIADGDMVEVEQSR